MKKILAVVSIALAATGAVAESRSIQLSLIPDIALVNRTETINGLSLNIWGENPQTALAIGLVNGSIGESAGLSIGVLNYAESYSGLQWGLINYTAKDLSGWQGGFCLGLVGSVVNYTGGAMSGFQCGIVNYADSMTGLQLGLLNCAKTANAGVQVGLINIMPENQFFTGLPDELAPGMIIVNWRF